MPAPDWESLLWVRSLTAPHDQGPLLSEIFKKWEGERKPNPKTLVEWEAAFRLFYEIVGDKPIREISREDVRSFKDTSLKLPTRRASKYRGMSIAETIDRARKDLSTKFLSPATVNKFLTALGSVCAFAETNGYIDRNPVQKLKVTGPVNRRSERLPYSDADLRTIFSSPIYTGCAGPRNRLRPGSLIIHDSLYWLPLMALYTGARVEELCQSEVRDIKEIRGIWVLNVDDAEGDKSLKASSSRRLIPLHPQLIEAGFLKYVEDLKRKGEKRLFPDLTRGAYGKWSANWSKNWGRYRKKMGITDPRKVFHSFRHRFRDALRDAQVDTGVRGHDRARADL